ncbi:MAG TPA: nucleotidyltransferase [Methanomicrobia archaeon]|nr:nucleotidyltransferase [Methanomicrobia archaeon]
MDKSVHELLATIKAHKHILKERYKVKEIGVFGSFVRSEQTTESDVDILVDFYEVPDLLDFINLERYLQRVLRKKVELVRKPVVRKELRERILNEVVYA